MYDFYTSLGENCEVAFQIRRILGMDDSSFFSWNITTVAAFNALMDGEFANVMETTNLQFYSDSLIKDVRYGYMFHSDFICTEETVFRDFEERLTLKRDKARYLIEKLRINASSDGRILYIYKHSGLLDGDSDGSARSMAEGMLERLIRFHEKDNFDLVFVQDEAAREEDWAVPNLKNRYLARLASFADATDGHVQSWDRLFSEFQHVRPLRLSGF
jgi:hypothetical protein